MALAKASKSHMTRRGTDKGSLKPVSRRVLSGRVGEVSAALLSMRRAPGQVPGFPGRKDTGRGAFAAVKSGRPRLFVKIPLGRREPDCRVPQHFSRFARVEESLMSDRVVRLGLAVLLCGLA